MNLLMFSFSLSSLCSDIQGNLPPDTEVLSRHRSRDIIGWAFDAQAGPPRPGCSSFCSVRSLVRLKLAKALESGRFRMIFSEKPVDETEDHSLPTNTNTKFCKWVREACEWQRTPQPILPVRSVITAAREAEGKRMASSRSAWAA